MKENYWILGELETDMNFIKQQQEKQNLKEKLYGEKELKSGQSNNDNNRRRYLKNIHQHQSDGREKRILNGQKLNSDIERNKEANIDTVTNLKDNSQTSDSTRQQQDHRDDVADENKNIHYHSSPLTNLEERATRNDKQSANLVKRAKKDKKANNSEEVNLSFCGCGFLGIYHVGVASCFHEYAPQLSMQKISGSSAGALVAVAHICGNLQLAYATTDILRVAIDARARALGPFHPSFDINATVREALERGLPDDVHIKASGKLHVSLTRVYDGENVVISQFDSKEDVIQVLLCSCFIPFWSGLVAPKFKGITYIDGGFSNNLLILDNKTVTVSPFAGEADICPQDDTLNLLQISLSNTSFSLTPNNLYRLSHALLPPPPEVLSDLCEQGFADGIRFLQRMNLITCTKCLEIRSSLIVTTNSNEDMIEAFEQQAQEHESSLKSISSFSENNHIRLEQQEQKMIEINDGIDLQRRNSVVSTTSQIYVHKSRDQQQQLDAHDNEMMEIEPDDDDYDMDDYNLRKQRLLLGDDFSQQSNCDECVLIRQKASINPLLPKQFSDRIRDACDTVNKSLSNWILSHRPIKYLSYLAAPYYLPIDISLALIYRFWQKLPIIRSQLLDCVYNLIDFLINILKRVHARSTTSTLLGPATIGWQEEEAIEYEKEMIRHRHLQKKITTTTSHQNMSTGTTTTTTVESLSSSFHHHSVKITAAASSTSSLSLNTAATSNNQPTQSRLSRNSRSSSSNQLHSLEDTFDSIVDVTSKQEARIFAYYFRDAKNRLQVTEIFDLQKAAELTSSLSSEASQ